jgi:hypothetical protein
VVRAGEVYENRVQGDRFVVREGSADTEGKRLVGDLYVRPGGRVAGKHTHAYITERFEVLSGTVRFHIDGRDELARPGNRSRSDRESCTTGGTSATTRRMSSSIFGRPSALS